VEDTDAAGGGWTLARTDHPEGGHALKKGARLELFCIRKSRTRE